jgi:hypothetical protein
MDKAQKRLAVNLVSSVVIIAIFIFAFANFKDYVNKAEAMRAFNKLGQKIVEYRNQHGLLPSESEIAGLKENIEGSARMGTIHYRAQWIGIDSPPETIVAYTKKSYHALVVESGFVVLRLDGQVQYIPTEEFEKILAKQQTMAEAEEMKKSQKSGQGF